MLKKIGLLGIVVFAIVFMSSLLTAGDVPVVAKVSADIAPSATMQSLCYSNVGGGLAPMKTLVGNYNFDQGTNRCYIKVYYSGSQVYSSGPFSASQISSNLASGVYVGPLDINATGSYYELNLVVTNGTTSLFSSVIRFPNPNLGTLTADTVSDNSVTSEKIADYAVNTSDLNDHSVTSAKIAYETITGNLIAEKTITWSRIADGTIMKEQIAATGAAASKVLAINSSNNGLVWVPQSAAGGSTTISGGAGITVSAGTGAYLVSLSDNGVTSAKIAAGAVNTSDLNDSSVTTAKIANGTITGYDIAAGTIKASNILGLTGTLTNGCVLVYNSSGGFNCQTFIQ